MEGYLLVAEEVDGLLSGFFLGSKFYDLYQNKRSVKELKYDREEHI